MDWYAQAVLHDGYVVDGVGFHPGGEKRMAMFAGGGLLPAFPPFVEEVFKSVMATIPEGTVSLARRHIQAEHAFFLALKDLPRGREFAEEAHKSSGLDEVHNEARAVSGMLDLLHEIHSNYQKAYWQWEAEQHLKRNGYRARQAST
jgi:hypothetical protein